MSQAAAPVFFNPLNTLEGADPWIRFHEGNYYLTTTQVSVIRMWKSPTIAGLATAEPTTIWQDPTPSRCCNMWAPEFHLLDGPNGKRWYLYYTAGTDGTLDNQRTHVLESAGTDPLGPYTYKAQLDDPSNNGWAIDGSILNMPDKTMYFLFSSWVGDEQKMFIAPMSDPWTVSGDRVLLSEPKLAWERSVGNVNEGPVALQRGGKTFIVYSASACWGDDYKLGLLTYNGGDVLDSASWLKSPEPVFERSNENGVYGPGHNGFFTSPDGKEDWIVYHANANAGDGCEGKRTTRVQKFTWNSDGTPNFGVPASLDTPITPPSGERAVEVAATPELYYTIIGKNDQCIAVQNDADASPLQIVACGDSAKQQWSLGFLGNGYYRLLNRESGKALTVTSDNATQEGAAIGQAEWAHTPNQQWRFAQAKDGWIRIETRQGRMVLDTGACAGDETKLQQQTAQAGNTCQEFRLQPTTTLRIVSANSRKPIVVDQNAATEAANVVQSSEADAPEQRWNVVHQGDGYYQVVSEFNNKCLAVTSATSTNGAPIGQQACSSDILQQWRFDKLNDGTVRLVARQNGRVIDAGDCKIADGVQIQEQVWSDTICQRFYLEAP